MGRTTESAMPCVYWHVYYTGELSVARSIWPAVPRKIWTVLAAFGWNFDARYCIWFVIYCITGDFDTPPAACWFVVVEKVTPRVELPVDYTDRRTEAARRSLRKRKNIMSELCIVYTPSIMHIDHSL